MYILMVVCSRLYVRTTPCIKESYKRKQIYVFKYDRIEMVDFVCRVRVWHFIWQLSVTTVADYG